MDIFRQLPLPFYKQQGLHVISKHIEIYLLVTDEKAYKESHKTCVRETSYQRCWKSFRFHVKYMLVTNSF